MASLVSSLVVATVPASNGTNQPIKLVDINNDRFQVVIQNRTSGAVFIGPLASLTTTQIAGKFVDSGQTLTDIGVGAIYAIAVSSVIDATGILLTCDYNK